MWREREREQRQNSGEVVAMMNAVAVFKTKGGSSSFSTLHSSLKSWGVFNFDRGSRRQPSVPTDIEVLVHWTVLITHQQWSAVLHKILWESRPSQVDTRALLVPLRDKPPSLLCSSWLHNIKLQSRGPNSKCRGQGIQEEAAAFTKEDVLASSLEDANRRALEPVLTTSWVSSSPWPS